MNQSKLIGNTGSWREARENEFKWVTIGFGFFLIGWKSGASFLSRSRSLRMCNQFVVDTTMEAAPFEIIG